MSGPYSQVEVEDILQGPFQCSPMIVSEQAQGPGEPPKLRVCCNLSKGTQAHPSTNDYIDKDCFPTKFGTAAQVAEIVSTFSHPLSRSIWPPSHVSLMCPPATNIHVPARAEPFSRLRVIPLFASAHHLIY
jgi:hypothetical protein